ncbi:hypothetical protein FGO68_gene4884 [Halteria grandinella]|uniref:Uncharacterized protein n=1 Tax=Halteria grandinella TaxID=5974 RepID=A0A8J8NEG4_HALGN|nr:hypothetical protein FGO68_gene4884 [Halteria grandinella]
MKWQGSNGLPSLAASLSAIIIGSVGTVVVLIMSVTMLATPVTTIIIVKDTLDSVSGSTGSTKTKQDIINVKNVTQLSHCIPLNGLSHPCYLSRLGLPSPPPLLLLMGTESCEKADMLAYWWGFGWRAFAQVMEGLRFQECQC